MAGQQLALGVGQCFEFGADLELAILAALTMYDLSAQQQAEGLGHQHHLDRQVATRRHGLAMIEADAAFGH